MSEITWNEFKEKMKDFNFPIELFYNIDKVINKTRDEWMIIDLLFSITMIIVSMFIFYVLFFSWIFDIWETLKWVGEGVEVRCLVLSSQP